MLYSLVNPVTIILLTLVVLHELGLLPHKHRYEPSAMTPKQSGAGPAASAGVNQTAPIISDVERMRASRISTIFDALRPSMSPSDVAAWLRTLDSNGKWPDSEIDYTTGCTARRANWPAEVHWQRILLMSAAWHGDPEGNTTDKNIHDDNLKSAISRAMDYWFHRDLTNLQCITAGGTPSCPCDDPSNTFWNPNWFGNVIYVPRDVGQACLLLGEDALTDFQLAKCKGMTNRAYFLFGQPLSFLQGANIIDISRLGVDGALLGTANITLISDAYQRVHKEMVIKTEVKADGTRPDGSFGQHKGLLYNGNYGKDFINSVVDLEIVAAGTAYSAPPDVRSSFETLINGSRWMSVRNVLTQTTHWDLSALNRFLTFPVSDPEGATGDMRIQPNLAELGQKWGSSTIASFMQTMSKNSSTANAGDFVGNRHFYANDYMVHRGSNYVSTVKTYSTRTLNSECINTQNPFGFHLSDNAVRTYIRGDEYEDIAGDWDWNLIPGTTVDYGDTPLSCNNITVTGLESFVGGVSDGTVGISLMRFTNPLTKNLRWQKAWFFLNDDVQHVMVSNLSSVSGSSSVRSVLDQRRQTGPVLVNDNQVTSANTTDVQSLWHGNMGYIFSDNVASVGRLFVQTKNASGNWTAIGTSTVQAATEPLFSAWIEHTRPFSPLSYTILPGISQSDFSSKRDSLPPTMVQNDNAISSVFDEKNNIVYAIFWQPGGGTIVLQSKGSSTTIVAKDPIALIYKLDKREITVSDPSHALSHTSITITTSSTSNVQIDFPQGGTGGNSVTQTVS